MEKTARISARPRRRAVESAVEIAALAHAEKGNLHEYILGGTLQMIHSWFAFYGSVNADAGVPAIRYGSRDAARRLPAGSYESVRRDAPFPL